jgi:hypothetical protein
MGWKWEELSVDAQRIMTERFIGIFQDGSVVDLSGLLNGFHQIEYNWKETDLVKQAIFAGIVKHFRSSSSNLIWEIQLANIIFYLGKSGIQWKDIRKDVRDSLFRGIFHCYRSFTEREISNTIYG